jgi:hypothetical protein
MDSIRKYQATISKLPLPPIISMTERSGWKMKRNNSLAVTNSKKMRDKISSDTMVLGPDDVKMQIGGITTRPKGELK